MTIEELRHRSIQILLKDVQWMADAIDRERDIDLAPYLKQVFRDVNCVRDMDMTYRSGKARGRVSDEG